MLRRAITGAPQSRPPIEPSHSTNGSPPTSSWPDWRPNSPAGGESRRRLSSPSRALGVVSSVATRRREREEKARLHSFIAVRGLFREVVVSLRPISPHDGYGDVRFVRAIMEEGVGECALVMQQAGPIRKSRCACFGGRVGTAGDGYGARNRRCREHKDPAAVSSLRGGHQSDALCLSTADGRGPRSRERNEEWRGE